MGCDIHFVVEVRANRFDAGTDEYVPEKPERWIGVYGTWQTPRLAATATPIPMATGAAPERTSSFDRLPVFTQRDYAFFAALAGVRGDGPEPKGMPQDASELAKYMIEKDGDDGHSHSWDSLEDFVRKWILSLEDEVTASAIADQLRGGDGLLCYLAGVWDKEELTNYRVVYWFDN